VRECKAALQEHLCQITKAQFVAHAPEDDQQNDVGREFQGVEGSSTSLVAGALTCLTAMQAAELWLLLGMGNT
jgi:hypothetical protein